MLMDKVLGIILAGGRGERLDVLAHKRTKPAVPFAGKYRIIDFTLSNCVNSGIHNVAILTQYQPLSLSDHIGVGAAWDLNRPDCVLTVIQAYLAGKGRGWYKGTADAVYQNFEFIEDQGAEVVIILSGDHVSKMDYSGMLKCHEETQADATLAVQRFPEEELERFGTVVVDQEGQVTGFQEKVKKPKGNLVSMGIYVFKTDILRQWLEKSGHDFGKNIFPRRVGKSRIFAYNFEGYWRDIGTIQAYWQSNMEMLKMSPDFLSDADWIIRTKGEERPPAIISDTASVVDSLISNGCIIEGHVEHSVLSPGVRVAEGAVVKDSIIFSDTIVGLHSVVNYSILDKEIIAEAGCHIGFGDNFQPNRKDPKLLNTGITVVGKGAKLPAGIKIGRNCVIGCNVGKGDFPTPEIQSGETIASRRRRLTSRA